MINPALPVDIFLPPSDFDNIHVLATKDENGLNTGVFFIHVHELSVRMIAKALAYPMFRPDVDLGISADQYAMELIFNETEFSQHILYQPRIWYNAYEFHHGYEGKAGDILVHFPGLEDDRWKHMLSWLDRIEGPEAKQWEVELAHTMYPDQIDKFWAQVRECRDTLSITDRHFDDNNSVPEDLMTAVENLRKVLSYWTDQMEVMHSAVMGVRHAMGGNALGIVATT